MQQVFINNVHKKLSSTSSQLIKYLDIVSYQVCICKSYSVHVFATIFIYLFIYLKLARCIERLSDFAEKNKSIPTLGYTHFQ